MTLPRPRVPTAYRWLAESYEQKGLYEQAIEAYLKEGDFSKLGPEAGAALREAYAASGWKGFWRKALDLKKEQAKQGNVSPYAFAENYARLGEKDLAFLWLEKAYEEHYWFVTTLNADPIWDDLRSDPRCADLVRRMGLEPASAQTPTATPAGVVTDPADRPRLIKPIGR